MCSPDGKSCVEDPGEADQEFAFEYNSDGTGPADIITARPGELIKFSLTLDADAPVLPNPNDPAWGPTFVIRPCKDINPNPLQVECEGGGPTAIGNIVPGATWEVSAGNMLDGTPSVGRFSWRVPDDVPETTYEIVFLIRFPGNGENGGGCCHWVRLRTTQSLEVATVGFGRVTSQPAGINCSLQHASPDCAQNFRVGTTVELTATPFLNGDFVEWRGCDSVDGRKCTLKMDTNRGPVAVFTGDAFNWEIFGSQSPSRVRARRGQELIFTFQGFVSPSQSGIPAPQEFQIWPCKDVDPHVSVVQCQGDTGTGTSIGSIFPGATWESTVGTNNRAAVGTFRWQVPEDAEEKSVDVHFVTRFHAIPGTGGGCCDVVTVQVI